MPERTLHKIDQTPYGQQPRRELVRRLLEQKEPITKREIQAYVDDLMVSLRQFSDPHEQVIFLTQDLQTDLVLQEAETMPMYRGKIRTIRSFFRNFFYDDPHEPTQRDALEGALKKKVWRKPKITREEIEAVLLPIRRAILEELKKQLTQEKDLGHISYTNLQFLLGAIPHFSEALNKWVDHPALHTARDANEHRNVVRLDKDYYDEITIKHHQRAVREFMQLGPQEHILPIKLLNSRSRNSVSPMVELHTLREDFRDQKRVQDPVEELSIVIDCMQGAKVLEEHGLVLQDIKPDNLGYVWKQVSKDDSPKKVGMLFDLEGLYPEGESIGHWRITAPISLAPDAHVFDRIFSAEMVYQFGLCLEKAFDVLKNQIPFSLRSPIISLLFDMLAFDMNSAKPTKRRISLTESIDRLQAMIDELTNQKQLAKKAIA